MFIPSTWMNHSGRAVAAICNYYRYEPQDMLVVHDELDFEPGLVRLKLAGGPGGHNGLRDVISALGSGDFHRLRIGIGHPGSAPQVSAYVLKRAPKVEQECIDASIDEALRVIPEVTNCDWPKAMNRLHSFDARVPEQD